ncbi:phosphoribosylaminoimidazolesuccinocarboxamide synthase, partial [Gammaproteobacteria bacterium]|nr:phosphoribosylaminoimidazolesuccinocarboxamide synthase [Gammaproteobacteria bacterium]
SKEGFRQLLLAHFPEPEILLDKNRMEERHALAKDNELPESVMMQVSDTYVNLAEKITGKSLIMSDNPKEEILTILDRDYGLID